MSSETNNFFDKFQSVFAAFFGEKFLTIFVAFSVLFFVKTDKNSSLTHLFIIGRNINGGQKNAEKCKPNFGVVIKNIILNIAINLKEESVSETSVNKAVLQKPKLP